MFGDVSTSTDKQTTLSYWANNHLLLPEQPDFEIPSQLHASPENELTSPIPDWRESTPPSPPLQPTANNTLITQPSLDEPNQTADLTHLISNDDLSDDESIYAESEVSKILNTTDIQAESSKSSEQVTDPTEQQIQVYDKIMTGWDPLPQLAGQKRTRSPDTQIMTTKREIQVIRRDYNNLSKGKTAQLSIDPSSWNDAMSSVDASLWKTAANDEFESLQK
ncbi:hypothetical protein EPUL_006286 [Erysiphe pulchra]|uniref:Uncharacterized protein n=1 Tax=Erysiphe pulchra TaxID=225359 RepID=A0A2S4PJF7_9PEZI|nr:hypothetical protein EPUL_006286 [Erysiphe pulchra]